MRNEEADLRTRFGTVFDEYAAKVPLFLPDFFGSGYVQHAESKSTQAFSWQLYRRNREYRALIGTVAAMAAVWLRMYLQRRYGY